MPHDASVSVIPQGVAGVLTLIRGGIVRVIAVCVLAVTLQYTPGRTEGSPWVVTYVGW